MQILPIECPKIKTSFIKQYPIKGDADTSTNTVYKLLKKDIIKPTQSFNFISPVLPVKKSNGQCRLTVDYRKINQISPQMLANVPDVEDIFLKIRNYNPKFFWCHKLIRHVL